jgi:hypothetical protein
MRFVICLLALVVSLPARAKDLVIEDGHRKYELTIAQKLITYKDELTSLTLAKKKCNAHILERLNKRFDKLLEQPFLEDARPEFLKVKIDGKQFYGARFGERAVYLLAFPREIKKLKMEEGFNCSSP